MKNIPENQPLIFFPADHLIENQIYFNKAVKKNIKNLNENNIFLFGIKPTSPSSEYGYLLTKKIKGKINTPDMVWLNPVFPAISHRVYLQNSCFFFELFEITI